MALIEKLTAIADAIRGKTGGTEGMTLDAMVSAIEGIESSGGGLPAGIAEYEVQTFTPEADTNEALTFSLDMDETPTHIYIATDIPEAIQRSFIAYYCGFPDEATNVGDGICMGGSAKAWATNFIHVVFANANSSTNRSGVWRLTNKGFTFRAPLYGGQHHYFRAGYTYTIFALRLVKL